VLGGVALIDRPEKCSCLVRALIDQALSHGTLFLRRATPLARAGVTLGRDHPSNESAESRLLLRGQRGESRPHAVSSTSPATSGQVPHKHVRTTGVGTQLKKSQMSRAAGDGCARFVDVYEKVLAGVGSEMKSAFDNEAAQSKGNTFANQPVAARRVA